MFRVGQKVVCISDERSERLKYPRKGEICTIVNIYTPPGCDGLALELAEFPAPETATLFAGWKATCFRPVVERKTDISIFTAMLNPTKQKVRA